MASGTSVLYIILLIIVIIGALNWGAVAINPTSNKPGCGGFVGRIFTNQKHQRFVYGVVGVSGVLLIGLSLFDMADKKKKVY